LNGVQYRYLGVMPIKEWTPERQALAGRVVRALRKDGYSYEEIVDILADSDGDPQLEPWEVYEFANPGKTQAQVMAWRKRHCPSGLTAVR
jgi:hypothetical protein